MHVVLVAPEIAPNTGNIIRLCANTGSKLHLIEPLGFSLDDRLLRRAGLDYHELADVTVHRSLEAAAAVLPSRWFGFSSQGARRFTEVAFDPDDVLVFGAERAGLPTAFLDQLPLDRVLTIPMVAGSRSLNLANAVAVVVYEAWRQLDFASASEGPVKLPAPTGLTSERPGDASFDG